MLFRSLPFDAEFDRHLRDAGLDPDELVDAMDAEEARENASTSKLRRMIGIYKAPRIGAVLAEELEERQYKKIVVFYQHTDVGDILHAALEPYGVVRLDGQTSTRLRAGIVDQFTTDADTRVFLGQQQAAGEALNLQEIGRAHV